MTAAVRVGDATLVQELRAAERRLVLVGDDVTACVVSAAASRLGSLLGPEAEPARYLHTAAGRAALAAAPFPSLGVCVWCGEPCDSDDAVITLAGDLLHDEVDGPRACARQLHDFMYSTDNAREA